jgi:hypothetical protein
MKAFVFCGDDSSPHERADHQNRADHVRRQPDLMQDDAARSTPGS